MTDKSDLGKLLYTDNAHPHAVTQAKGDKFTYDAVGNQITRPGGIAITYTPFDLPKTITQPGKTVSFGYDGNEERVRKTTPAAETLYFGGIFEQVTSSAGDVLERRYYVHSPERAIAIVTRGGMNAGNRFLHADHLGSIDAITKEDGSLVERRSYDVFGARRNPEWGASGLPFTSPTTRGFTGHEEDEDVGLVNMRGRIYDPKIGRFTTTDPVIADIWNGQSLNRYAYVEKEIVIPEIVIVEPRPDKIPTPPPPKDERAKAGAIAPPVDVGTTGNGGQGLPQETTPPEPPKRGILDGIWDGIIDFGSRANELIPGSPASLMAQMRTIVDVAEAYGNGDVIDAINVVNPLMGAATLGFAIDDEDWYTAGQAAVGVGVAILSVVVARKVGGGGKTTRGPPATGNKIPNNELQAPPARGKAPIGKDGHSVELHHRGQNPDGPLDEMTRTDHRGKGNFSKNHQNTGQKPSTIDRKTWKQQQQDYWKKEYDSGRFNE